MSIKDIAQSLVDTGIALVKTLGPASAKFEVHPDPRQPGAEQVLVRDGYSMKKLDGPDRRVRGHMYSDLGTFAAALNQHFQPSTTDILMNDHQVVADSNPHCVGVDIVRCSMSMHPRLSRWDDVLSAQMDQQSTLRLVVSCDGDFPFALTTKGKESSVRTGEGLAMQLTKLSIAKNSDYQCEIDERGFTRFQAANEKTKMSGALPPRFNINVPFFRGVLNPDGSEMLYNLVMHLRVDASGPKPMFVLDCPELPVIRYQALRDAALFLERQLDEGFLVGVGTHGTTIF